MSQTESQSSLSRFYKGWDVYQQRLITAIAPLTAEQLALRPAPQNWSVGMLVAHIISARAWWFHMRMGKGSAEFAPLALWDEDEEAPSRPAAELVAGLEKSWQLIQETLARLTPADLEQIFPHSSNQASLARSCQWMIWHVLEHDIHHSGELSSILGAHGLAAVNLD
ncbi:MAG TPA: DinB family protein [Ktedonobacteraceae bacterium]